MKRQLLKRVNTLNNCLANQKSDLDSAAALAALGRNCCTVGNHPQNQKPRTLIVGLRLKKATRKSGFFYAVWN